MSSSEPLRFTYWRYPNREERARVERICARIEADIVRMMRNQRIIDDIKRQCGATTEEKK